jgi:hypothetical protein
MVTDLWDLVVLKYTLLPNFLVRVKTEEICILSL